MALVLYYDCRWLFYNDYNVLEIEIKFEVHPGNFVAYRQDIRPWIRISDFFFFFPASVTVLFCVFTQRICAFWALVVPYMKGSDNFQCVWDLWYAFPWYFKLLWCLERKGNYWQTYLLSLRDNLSNIKCIPRLETKGRFWLGKCSIRRGKSLVVFVIRQYIFFSLNVQQNKRDK